MLVFFLMLNDFGCRQNIYFTYKYISIVQAVAIISFVS
jgi:hypothetical protein